MNIIKKIYSLQILRAVAALLVLFFHLSGSSKDIFDISFLGNIFYFGSSGVDIFFVLSGFIIYYTSHKKIGQGNFFNFISRRIIRVYPIYWVLITFMLIGMGVLSFETGHSITLVSLLKTYLLLPGHQMINGVSWSLSYEVYFYLIFGLLCFSKRLAVIPLIIVVISISNYLYPFLMDNKNIVRFLFSSHNIQFLLGVMVAYLITNRFIEFNKNWALFIFCTSIIGYTYYGIYHHRQSLDIVVYGILTCFFIVSAIPLEEKWHLDDSNLFVRLGDASYVLYLVQIPILRVIHKIVLNHFDIHSSNSYYQLHLINFVIIGFICVVSLKIHTMIEMPMIRILKSWMYRKSK